MPPHEELLLLSHQNLRRNSLNYNRICLLGVLLAAVLSTGAIAQQPEKQAASQAAKKHDKTQSELASKAIFGTIKADSTEVKKALDAKKMDEAFKLVGKTGSFKGTVDKAYAPKSNNLVILDFDKDFKSALTAVVKADDFAKLPDLKKLEGKEVLVTGTFIDYQKKAQIVISKIEQVKLIAAPAKPN